MIQWTWGDVLIKIWPGEILGLIMIIAMVWVFWNAQRDPKNPIDFATMLVWPGTKHTSLAFVAAFIGVLTATWIVVDMELKKLLTAEVFIGYMAVLIGGKGMTEWVNAWRGKAPTPAPPAAQNQYVASADTVTQPAPVAPAPMVPVVIVPDAPPVKIRKRK
jgi:hypothetical protein